jgi:subtilisin family serine protease
MKKLASLTIAFGLVACSEVPLDPTVSARGALNVPDRVSASVAGVPVPGTYIVRFRDSETDVDGRGKRLERNMGGVVERTYRSAIKGVSVRLADDAALALKSDPAVMSVEQDQTVSLSTTQANPTWGLDRIDQRNLPVSHGYSYSGDGTGVTVYIIDTGINFTHSEYFGRASTGIDEVTPGGTAADCNGHGSHVSGTVGGTTYGVAKNVKLVAVRVLDCSGNGTNSGVIAGIDWVTAHATLPAAANMSLGGGFSASLNAAVQSSINAGVVYGIAAGNATTTACSQSPSSAPNAIVVGATDASDTFAYFSNYGSCVHINAPGVNITSAWIGSNTATNTISGTSMASPHVVGAAALYLQVNPSATPAAVKAALTGNATPNVITGVPGGTPNLLLYTGFLSAPPAPVANFTSSCTALACAFDAGTSTGLSSATYGWTFGDASTGSGKTPSHTYASGGNYSVTLTVTDANGTSSKTSLVTVSAPSGNAAPVARFTATCPALQCTFDASTSSDDVGIVSYAWAWGNGRTETKLVPVTKNTFATPGTYTITLTVTDGGGLTHSVTQAVPVPTPATPPPNQAPTAAITAPAVGTSVVQGTSVSFAGTGSDPEQGALTGAALVWTSSLNGAIGTGTAFATTTLAVGTHTITLTAKDAQGATGTATRTVTVTAPPPPNQAPTATITAPAAGTSVVQGTSVSVAGTGSDPEDGALSGASLVWTSSLDGAIGTGTSFATTTLSVGTHTLTLTAKDAQGATGTATRTLTVTPIPAGNQAPVARFTANCATGFAHQCALDASTSTDDVGIVSYAWNWGNGRSETKLVPTTKNTWATAPGTFSVTLTVTDAGGLTSTVVKSITIP